LTQADIEKIAYPDTLGYLLERLLPEAIEKLRVKMANRLIRLPLPLWAQVELSWLPSLSKFKRMFTSGQMVQMFLEILIYVGNCYARPTIKHIGNV